MYDGINADAAAIHGSYPNTAYVAGYINGNYAWTTAEWNLFPKAVKVQISISASANAGDVLDVEAGDASASETAGWIRLRKSAGYYRPTIYTSRSNIPAVREGTGSYVLGTDYDIWVADWTGSAHEVTAPGPGVSAICSATQYENAANWDVSAVYDSGWPHRTAPSSGGGSGKVPAEPADVRVTAVTSTSVSLAWNASPGATSYRIRTTYQSALIGEISVPGPSADLTGLTPDHTYTFHVSASNSAGTSAETNGPDAKTSLS
jgi:hypothetical protein